MLFNRAGVWTVHSPLSAEQLFGIRCEAQQTPPISPRRSETAGAFQQLDLMRFHHQRGRRTSEGSHLEKYNYVP